VVVAAAALRRRAHLWSFGGMQGSATVTVTDATLISITVLPDPSIATATTVQERYPYAEPRMRGTAREDSQLVGDDNRGSRNARASD